MIPKSKICLVKFNSLERPAAVIASRAETLQDSDQSPFIDDGPIPSESTIKPSKNLKLRDFIRTNLKYNKKSTQKTDI